MVQLYVALVGVAPSHQSSRFPVLVLYDVLFFPRIGHHPAFHFSVRDLLAFDLLRLLLGRAADRPPKLSKDVRFDRCLLSDLSVRSGAVRQSLPSTQYGHRMCARFTRPQAEHLFSAVISFKPLPAKKRWRFLRYDVFFLGTALRIPSQISLSEGIRGSSRAGMASAAKGVGRTRKGCDRRCSSGRFRTGRTGRLGVRAGSSVCHKGGSGRARAIAVAWTALDE